MTMKTRPMKRPPSFLILNIDIRPVDDQLTKAFFITKIRRTVKRCKTVLILSVDIHPGYNQTFQLIDIVASDDREYCIIFPLTHRGKHSHPSDRALARRTTLDGPLIPIMIIHNIKVFRCLNSSDDMYFSWSDSRSSFSSLTSSNPSNKHTTASFPS